MFKHILIPVSSEFYPREVLERGGFLASKFQSIITMVYIIEEKTLDQADKQSDTLRTHYNRAETKKGIVREQIRAADTIIFNDAKYFFKKKGITLNEKIVKGEFSSVISNEICRNKYDLILMGFEKGCILNYKIFDSSDIPIWVESKISGGKRILAVCSNLAPNQKVPDISMKLAESLGWYLYMLYVVDKEDSVEVDARGARSSKMSEKRLMFKGSNFVEKMRKKGITANIVAGSLEKETVKAAANIQANLVIVGREQKKKRILGLPVKSIKRKIAEKCGYSILFIN